MKPILISSIVGILLLSPAASLRAQEGTAPSAADLPALIREVLERNPMLGSMRSKAEGASGIVRQAGAWPEPLVGVEFMGTPVTSFNPISDAMEINYFAQQMIPFPGKVPLAVEAAESTMRARHGEAHAVERDLVAEVKKQFAMAYAAQRRIEINTEAQSWAGRMLSSAETRYGVGLATQADVLRLRVELEKLRNDRASLERDLRAPVAMINMLRGQPGDSSIGHIGEMALPAFPYTVEDLTRRALEARASLAVKREERRMMEAELAMARRERLPDFMLGFKYKDVRMSTNFWELMIGVTVPIAPWASGKFDGKVEENEFNVRHAEQSAREEENAVRFQVYNAWNKAKTEWEMTERYRTAILPQSEQALVSLLMSYQTGRSDFLSLLDSFRMLTMYKMDHAMHLAEHLMERAELERAVGADLD